MNPQNSYEFAVEMHNVVVTVKCLTQMEKGETRLFEVVDVHGSIIIFSLPGNIL